MKVRQIFTWANLFLSAYLCTGCSAFWGDKYHERQRLKYVHAASRAELDSDYQTAEQLFTLALKEAQQIPTNNVCLAETWSDLARVKKQQRKFDEATDACVKAINTYQSILNRNQLVNDEQILRAAQAFQELGDLNMQGGKYDAAQSNFKHALQLYQKCKQDGIPASQTMDFKRGQCATVTKLAELYQIQNELAKSQSFYRQAFRLTENGSIPLEQKKNVAEQLHAVLLQIEKSGGSKNVPSEMRAQSHQANVNLQEPQNELYTKEGSYEQVESLRISASELFRAGKYKQAESLFLAAERNLELIDKTSDTRLTNLLDLAQCYSRQNKHREAQKTLHTILECEQTSTKRNPGARAHASCLLAAELIESKELSKSEQLLEQATKLGSQAPQSSLKIGPMVQTWKRLGQAYDRNGQFYRAVNAYSKALESAGEADKPSILWMLGCTYNNMRQMKKAESMFLEAVSRESARSGPGSPELVYILTSLGENYFYQGRLDEALSTCQQAVSILKTHKLENESYRASLFCHTGNIYCAKGQPEKAKPLYEHTLKLARNGHTAKDLCGVLQTLGRTCYQLGQYDEAKKYLEEAVTIAKKAGCGYSQSAEVLTQIRRRVQTTKKHD